MEGKGRGAGGASQFIGEVKKGRGDGQHAAGGAGAVDVF